MTRFVDVYLPDCVPGYPCLSSPRWSTELVRVDSGAEQVNQRWSHPLYRFTLPEAVRDMDVYEAIRDQWLAMRGPVHTWPWKDPLDFASVALAKPNVAPAVTMLDQTIGTGDGITRTFQLTKAYTRGANTYTRTISLPVLSSVLVSINGALAGSAVSPDTPYTVSRPGGVVTFTTAPANGAVIRAGFLFDVEVRFESDESFDGIVQTFGLGGFADLTFMEVRNCAD